MVLVITKLTNQMDQQNYQTYIVTVFLL